MRRALAVILGSVVLFLAGGSVQEHEAVFGKGAPVESPGLESESGAREAVRTYLRGYERGVLGGAPRLSATSGVGAALRRRSDEALSSIASRRPRPLGGLSGVVFGRASFPEAATASLDVEEHWSWEVETGVPRPITYEVRYDVERTPGGWRVVDALLLDVR